MGPSRAAPETDAVADSDVGQLCRTGRFPAGGCALVGHWHAGLSEVACHASRSTRHQEACRSGRIVARGVPLPRVNYGGLSFAQENGRHDYPVALLTELELTFENVEPLEELVLMGRGPPAGFGQHLDQVEFVASLGRID